MEAYQKRWNEKECSMHTFRFARKVELDLLCVVEKELATRGLGVPENRIERELRFQRAFTYLFIFV